MKNRDEIFERWQKDYKFNGSDWAIVDALAASFKEGYNSGYNGAIIVIEMLLSTSRNNAESDALKMVLSKLKEENFFS